MLTIRNIDDDVLEAFRRRAAANDRSTEAEAGVPIRRAVGKPDRAGFIEATRRLREAMPLIDPPITTELLREVRDR